MKTARIRPLLLPALACAGLLPAGCDININVGDGGYSFDYEGETASRSQSGPLPADVRTVEVDNQFGKVVLEGTDDEWGWTWNLKTWGDDQFAAERYLQETHLEVEQGPGVSSWTVHLPDDADDLNGLESDLIIRVPRGVNVEVDHSFGATRLKNLTGNIEADTSFGDLELTNLSGTIRASNSFANLTANNIEGEIDLDHSYGELEAHNVRGNIDVENSFGNIVFIGDPTTLDCDHSYGDAHFTISGLSLTRLDAENSFGDLDVVLPPALRVDLAGSTSFGSVTTDLSDVRVSSGRHDESISIKESGAAATLVLESSHGSIHVRRAE